MGNMCTTLGRVDQYLAFYRMLATLDLNLLKPITHIQTIYDTKKTVQNFTCIVYTNYMVLEHTV